MHKSGLIEEGIQHAEKVRAARELVEALQRLKCPHYRAVFLLAFQLRSQRHSGCLGPEFWVVLLLVHPALGAKDPQELAAHGQHLFAVQQPAEIDVSLLL